MTTLPAGTIFTPEKKTEDVCECGHEQADHIIEAGGCQNIIVGRYVDRNCPCPAFTPKKEDRK